MDTKIMIGVLVALIVIVMVYMRMKKKSASGSGSGAPKALQTWSITDGYRTDTIISCPSGVINVETAYYSPSAYAPTYAPEILAATKTLLNGKSSVKIPANTNLVALVAGGKDPAQGDPKTFTGTYSCQ